ncbi:MAG TPA: DUF4388 domain-containing protein [Thermoanaerobaculia bacterium]|nr:DUF4388 domain-containing protein [Thermoanaerobaculia bacterium]
MAFQGSIKELPLPDIIQLVSVSGKTGVFELRHGSAAGEIFLRDGQIVHATSGALAGEDAVFELAVWTDGEFVFHPGREAPLTSIKRSNTNLLMEAARRIDEWQVLSKKIPSTRLVPIFTEQAKKTSVSLTPAEWLLISRIDERRSIDELAVALNESPFEVSKNLYGLITSGLVALEENLAGLDLGRVSSWPQERVRSLLERVYAEANAMLGTQAGNSELGSALRLAQLEASSGRSLDAVVDLLRSCSKATLAAGGPAAATTFRERVATLLSGR